MKQTTLLVDQLKSYFGATLIGSYLFLEAGFLTEDDINDIDIVPRPGRVEDTKRFLEDNGFKTADGIRYHSQDYDKPIDVLQTLAGQPRTVPELMKFKFGRGYIDDLNQLEKVIISKKTKVHGDK